MEIIITLLVIYLFVGVLLARLVKIANGKYSPPLLPIVFLWLPGIVAEAFRRKGIK